jgi:hypothetical protein
MRKTIWMVFTVAAAVLASSDEPGDGNSSTRGGDTIHRTLYSQNDVKE